MVAHRESVSLQHTFRLTLLIFAVIGFLYLAAEVLKPLALAVLLSLALTPVVRRLERWGLPRFVAAASTLVIILALIGGVGYVVGQQLTGLAHRLADYQDNIEAKLRRLMRPDEKTAADRLQELADRVTARLQEPMPPKQDDQAKSNAAAQLAPLPKVEVVRQPSVQERLRTAVGPYLENLGVCSFVLILVLFMLVGRQSLGERVMALFGAQKVSLTTKSLEEIRQRISRYLVTFALVNSAYGLVIGVGLSLIGVPYAVLWGCLAAVTRFIPYVGPAVAFALPMTFSFAVFEGWRELIEVLALFGVVETLLNSFLEPVIYGKTTGVSALSLLIAAMFWTWLWGSLGLVLSTPLTVCLAVLGKYVQSLRFFAVLLGEEADLDPSVRFYQRMVALDRDGAMDLAEELVKQMPRADFFDRVLIPTLSLAKRDAELELLGEAEQTFIWQVVSDVVDQLEAAPESEAGLEAAGSAPSERDAAGFEVIGVAGDDAADVLALKMLRHLVSPWNCTIQIVEDADSPLQAAERVAETSAALVVLSYVPPAPLSTARYMVQKLRAHAGRMAIVVGRWGETGGAASAADRLCGVGATHVAFSLAEARDRIKSRIERTREAETDAAAEPSLATGST
jgi:predicted PurR-regulated permease PerM